MRRARHLSLVCLNTVLVATLSRAQDADSQSPSVLTNVANPLYGTRVSADTQYSDSYSGKNAADGRFEQGDANSQSSRCWFSQDWTKLPCALTFELREEEDLRRVVLVQSKWQGNMYHSREIALEVSTDGKAWNRIGTGQLQDESLARLDMELRVKTRWLRVLILTSYNSQQTCGLAEVELLAAGYIGFGIPEVKFNRRPAPPGSASLFGMSLVLGESGPQLAFAGPSSFLACVRKGEECSVILPMIGARGPIDLLAEVRLVEGSRAEVSLGEESRFDRRATLTPRASRVALVSRFTPDKGPLRIALTTTTVSGEAAVEWRHLRITAAKRSFSMPLSLPVSNPPAGPPPCLPNLRLPLQRAMIEWDWKLQDGIDTGANGDRPACQPVSYSAAVDKILARGQRLIDDLCRSGLRSTIAPSIKRWEDVKRCRVGLSAKGVIEGESWEDLYLKVHWLQRQIALLNPLARLGPLLFVKHVPGCFSHQLTQYYGRYARPGGGVFVLDSPGISMDCRQLAPAALTAGSFMHPEVSYDGKRILFAYCKVNRTPEDTIQGHRGRYFHLFEMQADGGNVRQLTDGPYDDFSPRYLPDGRILFVSTRRKGWHRCGSPGCENYTLAVANPDGSNPRSLSFHETQEWDPAVQHDGRIIYTRWDYVDRHPVFYEHLWTASQDGSGPAAFFGNNTFNPIGLWEPRPIPNSPRLMATAGAHHAMTAGSIVLVDVKAGLNGLSPLTRLTPDAPFPESETNVGGSWHAAMPGVTPYETPEAHRWPGHCYKTAYPLSETYFLVSYSFQGLLGEPRGNAPNMFGLYLVDAFGNKELLYRDTNISCLSPVPLRTRFRPPVLPSSLDRDLGEEGTFLLQDVYASSPALPPGSIKALRVVQVLPKSTPGIDNPPVGRPRGAPGKQVLGTVPVEPDGSAYFRVPARVEVAFQALDDKGMALQVMRSGAYLQPGERASC
ncbi:MAG: discoidin domain-containing protein, partial [Armatimonadetes bacterium]|nr:discoidin domain-containing protein [Armatimonadota bacterium]